MYKACPNIDPDSRPGVVNVQVFTVGWHRCREEPNQPGNDKLAILDATDEGFERGLTTGIAQHLG